MGDIPTACVGCPFYADMPQIVGQGYRAYEVHKPFCYMGYTIAEEAGCKIGGVDTNGN